MSVLRSRILTDLTVILCLTARPLASQVPVEIVPATDTAAQAYVAALTGAVLASPSFALVGSDSRLRHVRVAVTVGGGVQDPNGTTFRGVAVTATAAPGPCGEGLLMAVSIYQVGAETDAARYQLPRLRAAADSLKVRDRSP